jgi:endonuclease-3 related protein
MRKTRDYHQRLLEIYHRLFQRYGSQHWWPGDGPFEVIIGAILTQAASWRNVELALANLRAACLLGPKALREVPLERLEALLRPCGYYTAKARKVKAFVEFLGQRYQDSLTALFNQDTEGLRHELLSVYGIGEETADSILLYAGQHPVFVIDAYTRRIVDRLGFRRPRSTYGDYQSLFMAHLPKEATLFNEYHALLVRLGKETCRKEPLCASCCLRMLCATGRKRAPVAARSAP